MTEQVDIQAVQKAGGDNAPAMPAPMESPRSPLPDVKGRVNRHTSGYWALTIPALSVRYLAEAASGIFSLNLGKKLGVSELSKEKKLGIENVYAGVVGAFMMTVSSFYMKRTYDDIKGAFAEAVAMETGKKPEDVGVRDLLKSDNTLVEAARHNFIKYNSRRFAVNLPFFANRVFKENVDPKNAVLLGTAANSLYLMNDVLSRKETFFERLQSFVDGKIVHSEQIGDKIKAVDLINLYELHARDKDPKYQFNGRMDTQEWQDKVKIFGRMAELLNETYGNEPNKDKANFNLSKMIYLMGHGMVDAKTPERSCTMIEVANRYGIEAVKDIQAHASAKEEVAYARQRYPVTVAGECAAKQEQPRDGFAAKFASCAGMSNGDKIIAQQRAASDGAFVHTA